MVRSPSIRPAVLLAVLALLLPLAAVAGACTDCLWGGSPECCPPSCCSCCVHSPSVLTAAIAVAPLPSTLEGAPHRQEDRSPAFHPRDIFHVPKSSPA